MAKISFKRTDEQDRLIGKIWERIKGRYKEDDVHLQMDLLATHNNGTPLDFERLANFDDFNLLHDVYGIYEHLDRETGQLMNHFRPRCSLPQPETV